MMQREIEFRGKRAGEEHWIYGYLREVFGRTKRVFMISPSRKFEADGLTDTEEDYVEAETIGQFTGKYDKNQRKVYGATSSFSKATMAKREKWSYALKMGHSSLDITREVQQRKDRCFSVTNARLLETFTITRNC